MRTFEEAWADKEAAGYKYGRDAREQVKFGYLIAQEEMAKAGAFIHKLETGEPDKQPKVDEDLVSYLGASAELLQNLADQPMNEVWIHSDAVNHVLDLAKRLGEEHRTMYLPYSYMVEKLFNKMNSREEALMHAAIGMAGEAGEAIDCIKKMWVYKKPLDPVNLLEELGDLTFYIQAALNLMGWTWADVRMANRMKLAKRYPDGVYSNEAAQARADKQ